MSGQSSARWDINPTDPAITPWPYLRQSGDVPPGLYELSPANGNNATYYIILYAKAVHFMDFDHSNDADKEFSRITYSFKNLIPELFPDARVLLLWNVTLGFTTSDLMVIIKLFETLTSQHHLGHSPAIYIVLEPDQVVSLQRIYN